MNKSINLMHLYPRDMNIYGDWGNVLTIKRRLEWRGYEVNLINYNPGDTFPEEVDIIVGGGGQDAGQEIIQDDLLKIGDKLKRLADNNLPMLMICGMYQLFGKSFTTGNGTVIKGIGLLDAETVAGHERLIGNIIIRNPSFGLIVGYENHSGQTYLGANVQPLGSVVKGAGNNGRDKTEGAIYKNVLGSYLHGPLLPKNPAVADFLIDAAVSNKYHNRDDITPDDTLARAARRIAIKRPR